MRQKNALSNFLNEKNPKQRYLIAQIPIQKKIDSGPTEQELMEEKLKYQKPLTNAGRLKLKQMMKSRGLV